MAYTNLPSRRCAVCPRVFTPKKPNQRACQIDPCGRQLGADIRRLRGSNDNTEAIRALKLKVKRRIEAATRAQFGPISSREAELFNLAHRVGYTRGYNAAYHKAGRR